MVRAGPWALPGTRDRQGEAVALVNIDAIYHTLGRRQAVLELFQQALTIFADAGDLSYQATTYSKWP
jgi:hypothetical protein